jgi:hypothetical protein
MLGYQSNQDCDSVDVDLEPTAPRFHPPTPKQGQKMAVFVKKPFPVLENQPILTQVSSVFDENHRIRWVTIFLGPPNS